MKIIIEIPVEFKEHYKRDKFKDSLKKIMNYYLEHRNCLCGMRYEYETIEMLEIALENSKLITDINNSIINECIEIVKFHMNSWDGIEHAIEELKGRLEYEN